MASVRASAAYRIAFTCSAAFALAILLLGGAVYLAADSAFRTQRDSAIQEAIVALKSQPDLAALRREVSEREASASTEALGFAVFDRAGRRIAGSMVTSRPPLGWSTIVFRDPAEGEDSAHALAVARDDGSRIVVAADSETIEVIDATILELFSVAFVAVLLVGLCGALLLGSYLRRRLGAISRTARAVVAGDLAQRVPIGAADDEFDQVGHALNTMLDRIAHLMENLRQVSSDVAHDLRTPLLRLRNRLEQVGTVEGAAEKAIEQGDALLALFTAILRISEVEGGALVQSFAPVDLSLLATDVAESYAPAMADSDHALSWSIEPGICVLGHRELLAQAIGNLLDNVRVHTGQGTAARLILAGIGTVAQVTVVDDGPGVPAADHERILQRFARTEASRTKAGNGLGLSLVAAITAAHGGTIAIARGTVGLGVTLALPRSHSGGGYAQVGKL
ncbi:HAMP domain-containing sensor histidine kinase [Sphingomonas sp. TREG-RG-20F-R18-01]|uniref:sensor histidine kinase n=1 Tax=Sphingomonas sp. TREG-RG-20F-R18-01 TaxID=2914982 RepID=UPI001F59301F|nr:HAMP domain-containing sensor histidine kinase [Sphingomonas sp. TREG-RG-20F-R18-01]